MSGYVEYETDLNEKDMKQPVDVDVAPIPPPLQFIPEDAPESRHLKRKMKSRHVNMLAAAGTIGSSLWITSGKTIATGGPAGALFGFLIMGVAVYWVITALGEMLTVLPLPGSFNSLPSKFVDSSVGAALAWNYWANWAIVVAWEGSALGLIMQSWVSSDKCPPWAWAIILFAFVTLVNAFGVRNYAELEYWISALKIVVCTLFIIVGILVTSGAVGPGHIGGRSWTIEGAPFHDGGLGWFNCLITAAFLYNGTELIATTAAEVSNPVKAIPRTAKRTFGRIVLFFLTTILFIGLIFPYNDPVLKTASQSNLADGPYARVFTLAGMPGAVDSMTAFIMISIVSSTNSACYASTRVLQNLADNGRAPRFFGRVSGKRGVPYPALAATMLVGCLSFLGSIWGNGVVLSWLQAIIGVAGLITWATILVTHAGFRRALSAQGISASRLPYTSPLYPYGHIFAFLFCIVVIFGQGWNTVPNASSDPKDFIAAYIGIPFFIVILLGYKIGLRSKLVNPLMVDLTEVIAVIERHEKEQADKAQGIASQTSHGGEDEAHKPWWQRIWAKI